MYGLGTYSRILYVVGDTQTALEIHHSKEPLNQDTSLCTKAKQGFHCSIHLQCSNWPMYMYMHMCNVSMGVS